MLRGRPPHPVSSRWGQRPPPAHRAAGSRTRFKPLPAALANHMGERSPVCGGRRGGLASEGGPEFGATEAHAGPGRGGAEAGVHTLRPGVPLRQRCWRRETACQHGNRLGHSDGGEGTSLATRRSAPGQHTGKEGRLGFCLKLTKMEKGRTCTWQEQTARACEDWGGGPSSRFLSVVLGTSVRAHQHALLLERERGKKIQGICKLLRMVSSERRAALASGGARQN